MPEMSGRKCLEELLKMNPNAKVLIASGYAANGPAKEARESGAVGFVSQAVRSETDFVGNQEVPGQGLMSILVIPCSRGNGKFHH